MNKLRVLRALPLACAFTVLLSTALFGASAPLSPAQMALYQGAAPNNILTQALRRLKLFGPEVLLHCVRQ